MMQRFLTIGNIKKATAAATLVGVTSFVSREYWKPRLPNTSGVSLGKIDLEISKNLPKFSDEIFENTDNLAVFLVPSAAVHETAHRKIAEILSAVGKLDEKSPLRRAKFFFRYPTEAPESAKEVILVFYKGQRKHREFLDEKSLSRVKEWERFFENVSDSRTPDELSGSAAVREITGNSFPAEVTNSTTPVLLEMYEKNCFLCFLMRPFLNSVARDLKDEGVPVTLKRLEIESNDFPDNCPIARGTPTFCFYGGKSFEKWSEFRPQEFVKKLFKSVEVPLKLQEKIKKFPGLLSERFQLFSTVVMWQTEIEKAQIALAQKIFVNEDKEMFNANVTAAMAEDAARSDDLEANLKYFRREAESAEMDAILIGQQLAEKILGV